MSDVETVAPQAEAETPREPCLCGCGDTPKHKKSRFMPGHDAQLKAALYRTIRDETLDDAVRQEARDRVDAFDWPQPAPKKAKKAKADANGEAEAPADVTVSDL